MLGDEDIRSFLDSAERSFRLTAVQAVLDQGLVQQFEQELRAALAREQDPECRTLIQTTLKSFEGTRPPDPSSPQVFLVSDGVPDEEKIAYLSGTGSDTRQLLAGNIEHLLGRVSPLVEATLLFQGARFFPDAKLPLIAKRLSSPALTVRMAA